MVPGAGATEIELAKQISSYGEVRFILTICCTYYLYSCDPLFINFQIYPVMHFRKDLYISHMIFSTCTSIQTDPR